MREGITFDDVLLVPKFSGVASREDVDLTTELVPGFTLGLPILSSNMDTVTEWKMAAEMDHYGGLGVVHRFMDTDRQVEQIALLKKAKCRAGAAIGVQAHEISRGLALLEAGVDVLFLDIAHGHHGLVGEILDEFRKYVKTDVKIVAGNVATKDGVKYLIDHGASGIKVGIGPGSVCSTRVITGCGMPQLTAIMDAVDAYVEYGLPPYIVADGGIRNSGDIVKALAAGASTVMLGGLLAGCSEAPTELSVRATGPVKEYRGMASQQAMDAFPRLRNNGYNKRTPEGVRTYVPYTGPVSDTLMNLKGGIMSGFSYCGARTLGELWEKAEFIRITQAGYSESLYRR